MGDGCKEVEVAEDWEGERAGREAGGGTGFGEDGSGKESGDEPDKEENGDGLDVDHGLTFGLK